MLQAGQLGQPSIPLAFPEGWLLDDEGASIREARVAPTDVAAALVGLGIASADLACGHSSFTLNNLLACLIATDILQVRCLSLQQHSLPLQDKRLTALPDQQQACHALCFAKGQCDRLCTMRPRQGLHSSAAGILFASHTACMRAALL